MAINNENELLNIFCVSSRNADVKFIFTRNANKKTPLTQLINMDIARYYNFLKSDENKKCDPRYIVFYANSIQYDKIFTGTAAECSAYRLINGNTDGLHGDRAVIDKLETDMLAKTQPFTKVIRFKVPISIAEMKIARKTYNDKYYSVTKLLKDIMRLVEDEHDNHHA